jgi:hypothetical protein
VIHCDISGAFIEARTYSTDSLPLPLIGLCLLPDSSFVGVGNALGGTFTLHLDPDLDVSSFWASHLAFYNQQLAFIASWHSGLPLNGRLSYMGGRQLGYWRRCLGGPDG